MADEQPSMTIRAGFDDLFAELDAVTRERDEAMRALQSAYGRLNTALRERDEARRLVEDGNRCRSTWQGRRCRDVNGHDGIHVAEDESDWIDGDGPSSDPAATCGLISFGTVCEQPENHDGACDDA